MTSPDFTRPAGTSGTRALPGCQASDLSVPQLVAQVYEAAPLADRRQLLERLLRPLGVLSLVAIAGGIFAKVRLRAGWQDFHVRIEDTLPVRPSDVVALVEHVQQVSIEAVDGLAHWLTASPALASSAAAALLATILLQRSEAAGRTLAQDLPTT